MVKKSKSSSVLPGQMNLFQKQVEQELTQATKQNNADIPVTNISNQAAVNVQDIRCPKCNYLAKESKREPGMYYCPSGCQENGDNFRFKP